MTVQPYPRFDRFEIIRILGKGGMGTVYLARDQRLGRQVALKVLNVEEVATEEQRLRFLREARVAAAVRHQNIATIYEVDETAEQIPFIVMEYCEGETVAERLKKRPFDSLEFMRIARQVAAAVAAAHAQGVIHRDLKSANIMIEPSGLVKILDFGLARRMSLTGVPNTFESTHTHLLGTLHYLSPEQVRGQSADERSDLFSIGVVLYQMASGHLPFTGEPALMVLEKIRDSEPEPFVPVDSSFPPSAIKIINRLLQKKPADRYQSAADLLRDLEAIETPTERVSIHRSKLGRTLPRPRGARIAIAVIALAIVMAAALYVRFRAPGTPAPPPQPAPLAPIRSMAVLPLSNLANNTQDDFLSVAVADALVTKLEQIPSLQVRPTSSILEFRNQKVDARTVSRKLGVDGVLEGHFLAAGDLVRVNLQLIDARSGYNIWADAIDGKRDNLLKLVDDVSARTLSGLAPKLGIGEESVATGSLPRSTNPKAYEEYLRARSMAGSLVPQEYEAHIASLKRAIELDPNFAAAYADLALAITIGHTRSLTSDPDAIQKAEWYARQAIRLDPNLARAHLALGRVFVRYPERFRESTREVLAALRLNATDSQALHSLITYFISAGDPQKAQCVLDRLVLLEPDSNEAKTRGYYFINAVDPEGALKNAKYALSSEETELAGHDIRANAFILLGKLQEAREEEKKATNLVPSHYIGKSLKAMIAAASGDADLAEASIRSFEGDAKRHHWAAIRVAYTYAKLGNFDEAVKWAERAEKLGHHSWYSMVRHPWMQPLQGDPRYQAILARIKADLDDVRDDVVGVNQLICR